MADLILTNAHIFDPGYLDMTGDVAVENGKISKIYLEGMRAHSSNGAEIINAKGLLLVPGLIDMHTHLRDPGQTHKESIATGAMAAVKGGFTGICCMANTSPVNDSPETTRYILQEARKVNLCRIFPIAAVTKGLKGAEFVDFDAMRAAGAMGFSDDGVPVLQSDLMAKALQKAAKLNLPLISHCEDPYLVRNRVVIRDGAIASELGLKGVPAATETIMVVRDLFVAEITGCPVHIAHVSTRASVEAIRQFKQRGVKVTCETAPHYFTLTANALLKHGANAKMNPPLGTEDDRAAVIEGLMDGTIDVIATDHAPHAADEKSAPLAQTPNGIVGLETALPLSLALTRHGIGLDKIISALSRNPAKILGVESGIYEGAPANLTLINPKLSHTVKARDFASKSRNTPFDGMPVTGLAAVTIAEGRVVWQNQAALA